MHTDAIDDPNEEHDEEFWCFIHNKEKREVIDPFQADVYGIEVEMLLCEDCEEDRRDDI